MADLRAFLRWSRKNGNSSGTTLGLDTADIQAYCSYLHDAKGNASTTVNRRLQTLRKFYEFARAQGWTESNPASEVPLLDEGVSERSRSLSVEEVDHLLAVVGESQSRWAVRDRAIMYVLVGAGLKLGELIRLRDGHVHLDGDSPRLEVCEDSGEISRTVPLDEEVCAALQAYLTIRQTAQGVDHFFANRDGNPLSTRSVQRLLQRCARAAGLEDLTTQALRYVYARRMYKRLGDVERVGRLLGHRHLATTIRYLRSSSENSANS
jgi:site-specific recombinase XerD